MDDVTSPCSLRDAAHYHAQISRYVLSDQTRKKCSERRDGIESIVSEAEQMKLPCNATGKVVYSPAGHSWDLQPRTQTPGH